MNPLFIVPCSSRKSRPAGTVASAAALYSASPLFCAHMELVRSMNGRAIVLSAKYGFIRLRDRIESYNVSFTDRTAAGRAAQVTDRQLFDQAATFKPWNEPCIYLLGGVEYRTRARRALEAVGVNPGLIVEPFAGLPIGKLTRAVKLQAAAFRNYGRPAAVAIAASSAGRPAPVQLRLFAEVA